MQTVAILRRSVRSGDVFVHTSIEARRRKFGDFTVEQVAKVQRVHDQALLETQSTTWYLASGVGLQQMIDTLHEVGYATVPKWGETDKFEATAALAQALFGWWL